MEWNTPNSNTLVVFFLNTVLWVGYGLHCMHNNIDPCEVFHGNIETRS